MNAPSDRALLRWWDEQARRFGPGATLTCADCGRIDSYHYVQPQHPFFADGREDVARCGECLGKIQAQRRSERRAQLAARAKDCVRCAVRPHTFIYGGWRLCGRCKTATMREHHAAQATAGALAIFATAPLVDTRGWASHRASVAQRAGEP